MARTAVPFAALLLLAACAAPETQSAGKVSDMFATPEWAKGNQARARTTRAITQADLINADGSCALETPPAATDGVASDSPAANDPLAASGPLPAVAGGVGLGMTECQVVHRTGFPDTFNIGAEGAERVTTLTVTRGSWPGLYRFRGGRLVSIERIEVPAPARPARPAKSKKTATQSQPMPLRGAQQ
jgi:hypothetical protein